MERIIGTSKRTWCINRGFATKGLGIRFESWPFSKAGGKSVGVNPLNVDEDEFIINGIGPHVVVLTVHV